MSQQHRVWHIDAIRGLLVLLMVFYHLMWDLHFVGIYPVDVTRGRWHLFSQFIGSGFLLVSGISLALSVGRDRDRARTKAQLNRSKRGIKLLAWSCLITAVTWIFLREQLIIYGILHLIATAYLLSPILWRGGYVTPIVGVLLLLAGPTIDRISVDTYLLLPIGLTPKGYDFVDYYPIIPWLGFFMIGVGIGRLLYYEEKTPLGRPSPAPRGFKWVSFIGRHSLMIYLVHQPVLLAVLWLLGYGILM